MIFAYYKLRVQERIRAKRVRAKRVRQKRVRAKRVRAKIVRGQRGDTTVIECQSCLIT